LWLVGVAGGLSAKLTGQRAISSETPMTAGDTTRKAGTRPSPRLDHPSEEVRAAVAGLRELRRAIAVRREHMPAFTDAEIRSLIEEGLR